MPTRDEITTALAAQREHIEAWFRALPQADLERPLTPSEAESGAASGAMWRAKDHLAHIIGVERYFQGAVKRALSGAEDATGFYTQTGSDSREAARAFINESNERNIQKYQHESLEALLARLDESRQGTLALLAQTSDEQLAQRVAHSPFGDGTVGALFKTIADHQGQHLAWLTSALA